MEITKKDWEDLKKSAELNLKQNIISTYQFQTLLDLATSKIAEFPVEVDDLSEEDLLKEALKE